MFLFDALTLACLESSTTGKSRKHKSTSASGKGSGIGRTDGHSIRVFVRRASDYLIGGTYEVPSGLGGTFRVILKDACDTFAIVQNCGNCEDFDAMQPYRVPLDALMEIDDRRAA